jgi:hypothetical protein
MILWPLLFILQTIAQEHVVERYCYPSDAKALSAYRSAKMISVPSDKLETEGACLMIHMFEHRRELFQNYLSQLDTQMVTSFSSAEIRREPCRLKIEKVKTSESKSIGGKGSPREIKANALLKEKGCNEIYQIQTSKDFELAVNQDVIKGRCRSITTDRYEIILQVRKYPLPAQPTMAPVDQETIMLSTSLQLRTGDRVEIGSTVKELRDKNQRLELTSVETTEQTNLDRETVFLSIE